MPPSVVVEKPPLPDFPQPQKPLLSLSHQIAALSLQGTEPVKSDQPLGILGAVLGWLLSGLAEALGLAEAEGLVGLEEEAADGEAFGVPLGVVGLAQETLSARVARALARRAEGNLKFCMKNTPKILIVSTLKTMVFYRNVKSLSSYKYNIRINKSIFRLN